MKILEIIPSLKPFGGAESFVVSLSKALKGEHDVFVVSLYDFDDEYLKKYLSEQGIPLIQLGKKTGVDIKCARELRKVIDKIRPDVCHLHLQTFLTFWLSRRQSKQKNIYTFHTFVNKKTYGSKVSPSNILISHMLKKKQLIPVGISTSVQKSIASYFKITDVYNIPNGIEIERFAYDHQGKPKKYTFVSAGRIETVKNNLFMIKCYEKIHESHPDTSYIVLGEGSLLEECKQYSKMKNLNVVFKGFVRDVSQYLKESECLLLASHYEGNPLIINEAISTGVWVIANDVGGVSDLINNTNGQLALPEDFNSFYTQMENFLKNKKTIKDCIISQNIEANRKKVSIVETRKAYVSLFKSMI